MAGEPGRDLPQIRDTVQRTRRVLFAIGLLITLAFLGLTAWAVLTR